MLWNYSRRSSSGESLLAKQGTYHEQNGIQAIDYHFYYVFQLIELKDFPLSVKESVNRAN